MRTILFRTDSSATIGTGHIMRDLVLASQLEKQYPQAEILFATQNFKGNINHKISESGYEIIELKTNGQDELIEILKACHVDMLVIDNYEIDYQYELYIKEHCSVQILAFDDTHEKHNCDILLNHNISANKKRYKDLVPKNCELRCGAKYTLLRAEFIKEKKKKEKKTQTKIKTIFLAMGGADHSNINREILKVLEKFDNLKVNVAITTANRNFKELKSYVQGRKWINLHINSNKIAKLIKKSDFAIITPSVTANEVYFMGTPFIAIKTAQNQDEMYKYLKSKKFLVLENFQDKKLKKAITHLLKRENKNVK